MQLIWLQTDPLSSALVSEKDGSGMPREARKKERDKGDDRTRFLTILGFPVSHSYLS